MSDQAKQDRRRREREEDMPKPLSPDATDPHEDEPHHTLGSPAEDPDPTEFPDPYDRRPDPRGPEKVDTPAAPREDDEDDEDAGRSKGPPGPSTSEPHPPRNYDDLKPVKGDSA